MKRNYLLYLVILTLVLLPYGVAWVVRGDMFYSGLLFNPYDGYSYLAKMRQGWEGNWQFILPYSAEQNSGVYLFPFYLFLGHAARILHLSLAVVFQGARVLGSLWLMFTLERFLVRTLKFDPERVKRTLMLICLGSGLGWIALFWGKMMPDFWLAEAYPFLSMFANPHFPIGLSLMLILFQEVDSPAEWKGLCGLVVTGVALSAILPFGFAIITLVLVIKTAWELIKKRKTYYTNIAVILIPGGLWLVYQYAAIIGDPVLSQWNAQNITTTPPVLDLFIAFSPAVVLAAIGAAAILKKREMPGGRLLIAWIAGCALLSAIPFGLQRRFLTGIYIPIIIMAVSGLEILEGRWQIIRRYGFLMLLLLSIPTSFLTLGTFIGAGLRHDEMLYMSREERVAYEWIDQNLPENPLCLADPETGLRLPVYTGCRVIYGHPFESIQAASAKNAVEEFFSKRTSPEANQNYLNEKKIDYIVLVKREEIVSANLPMESVTLIYENSSVDVYQVNR